MANSLEQARKEINEIDKAMAELFVRRMRAAEAVAKYKKEHGIAILDEKREAEILERSIDLIDDENIRGYYLDFLKENMSLSKKYQAKFIDETQNAIYKNITVLGKYNISIGRGLVKHAKELFDLDRNVIIVTDSGVPKEYSQIVAKQCKEAKIITIPEGEGSKSVEEFTNILNEMLAFDMTRGDCVVAVGGGVVGDLAGFAAASFMRGIDFYNIPTTLLSQVDSSIGGKTAINLGGVKNIVGAFYQPKAVIIDPDLLKTLPDRQIRSGLAEAIKMAMTSDEELFKLIENCEISDEILEKIIIASLKIKKTIVEADERESGLRKVLNFGHTLGHGIEAVSGGDLYHGECVALGMQVVCSKEVKARLIPLLEKIGLPTKFEGDTETAISLIIHDKKNDKSKLSCIFVDKIGSFRIEKMDPIDFCNLVRKELI